MFGADLKDRDQQIPPQSVLELQDVEQSIVAAESILDTPIDPEDGQSPMYARETLDRATDFLRRTATHAWVSYRARARAPRIAPGPDGSIDILWKTGVRELLVTIPVAAEDLVTYYGNDRAQPDAPIRNSVEGVLELEARNDWLLLWVAQ